MKPASHRLSLSRRRLMGLAAAAVALPVVKSAGAAPAALSGRWLAESIRNRGVIGTVQMVIEIAADGEVTGSGGCNRISSKATVSGARISFSPMSSTEMACAPEIMDQESKFLSALGDARLWRIDEQRDKLILVDAHGVTILRLLRM
ncbi:MAG TPA: META domain-containing protein [Nordella sp.]|nr:META domain-containing protein [Nordella sp.]